MPTVPEGSVEEVIANWEIVLLLGATVMVRLVFADDPLPLSVTPKVEVSLAVGVPEMVPVDAAKDSPEGSLPEVMLHLSADVLPVAARVVL